MIINMEMSQMDQMKNKVLKLSEMQEYSKEKSKTLKGVEKTNYENLAQWLMELVLIKQKSGIPEQFI